MRELFELFFTFARIGVFTFGGGLAMLPMIQKEVVENKGWATEKQVLDYYALGQATPGIIAVNTATFIGYDRRGTIGGIFATLGMIFPSLVIIMTIATFITQFQDLAVVQHAFRGIRIAVVALIVSTVLKLVRQSVKRAKGVALFFVALVLIAFAGISPVYVILAAATFGVAYASYNAKQAGQTKGGGAE